VSSSAINRALQVSNLLISRLSAASAASAQTLANFRLKLIGDQLTNQLNKRIAELKAKSDGDQQLPLLNQQSAALSQKLADYAKAQAQISQNGNVLPDIGLQLGTLATAAQAGDATTFDQALTVARHDIELLQIVSFVPGLQPDGIEPLKTNGLGIQSSATYNLGTPAGRAQALSDVQAAQARILQQQGAGTQNEQLTASVTQSLETQLTEVNRQIANRQNTDIIEAAGEIAKLKQQTQTQFHLIELSFGKIAQSAGILTSIQNANNILPPPGSIVSVLVGDSNGGSLFVSNLPPSSATPQTTVQTTA